MIQRSTDDGRSWYPSIISDQHDPRARFRVLAKHVRPSDSAESIVRYSEGINCWSIAPNTDRATALGTWSPSLKEAMYASIRALGNSKRQPVVQQFLAKSAVLKDGKSDRLVTWASSISFSSLQPYWYLPNASHARWILKCRFDQCPTEDFFRTQFHGPIKRIEDRHQRACYLCPEIAPGKFCPETLVHTLLLCPHAALARKRALFSQQLVSLASSESALKLSNPVGLSFSDNSVLFTILQLCTGVGANYGASNGLLRHPIPSHISSPSIDPRLTPQFTRDSALSRKSIEWMQPLFRDWLRILHDPRRPETPSDSPGFKLAALVSTHLSTMFATRQSALASTPSLRAAFTSRRRDPFVVVDTGVASSPPPVAAALPAPTAPFHLIPNAGSQVQVFSDMLGSQRRRRRSRLPP